MSAFDRLLNTEILGDAWKQILQRFRQGQLGQLMSMQPIEVYNATLPYELDGAHMNVEFKAYVENVLQKRFKNAVSLLSLDFSSLGSSVLNYNCNVTVKVNMDYANMGKYLRDQFGNRPFDLFDGQVRLTFYDFRAAFNGQLLEVEIPMRIDARYKALKFSDQPSIVAKGKIKYQPSSYLVSIVDISYTIHSGGWLLQGVNLIYYQQIVAALEDFMQFNIKDELTDGLNLAREKISEYDQEVAFVSGEIDTLELERIEMHPDRGVGVFLAEGKIKLMQ
jgi:hypothetical protein